MESRNWRESWPTMRIVCGVIGTAFLHIAFMFIDLADPRIP